MGSGGIFQTQSHVQSQKNKQTNKENKTKQQQQQQQQNMGFLWIGPTTSFGEHLMSYESYDRIQALSFEACESDSTPSHN